MLRRSALIVATGCLGLLFMAGSVVDGAAAATFKRMVTVAPSRHQVVEGDRYTVMARIASPRNAKRLTLQQWTVPAYGTPTWESVRSVAVNGRSRVTFRRVATGLNSERFRARVTYSLGEPAVSQPVTVKVWRWIPLSNYPPYYATSGAIFGETTLNGQRYKGWGAATYSHVGAWEARFTAGRHCKAFQGVLGVADISADGSSGSISLAADEQTIYTSATLTPGMDVRVKLPLSLPYRFGIQAYDTSPDGVEAWPVIGDPELLCTGI